MDKEVFYFKKSEPIYLTVIKENEYRCKDSTYNRALKSSNKYWHLITIKHLNYAKSHILEAFFKITGDDEFFPVGYNREDKEDRFLVRNCWNAIDKLFEKQLFLNLSKYKVKLKMKITFNCCIFSLGQISPVNKLHEAISMQFQNIKQENANILNLQNLNAHPHLVDVFINLGCKKVLEYVFTYLKESKTNILKSISGINFSFNGIKSLQNFTNFEPYKFKLINLKENKIYHLDQLKYLVKLQCEEIHFEGNPVCDLLDFNDYMAKNFKHIKTDIVPDKIIPFTSTYDGGLARHGVVLDVNTDITEFKKSGNWHQIIVQHEKLFKKDEICQQFFAFFSLQFISHAFYICYYNEGETEDNFVVRNCYDHIQLLVNSDLKLNMVNSRELLPLKIVMNYAPFKKGQKDHQYIFNLPTKNFYNSMEKCLNLENFNSKEEMKNVIIDFSNPKLYIPLLEHFCQRYRHEIVEVRLGSNNIYNCEGLSFLNTLKKLRVLKLNNNRIRHVNDLEHLNLENLEQLCLDCNPLCQDYFNNGIKYVKDILLKFPKLTTLDYQPVSNEDFVGYTNYTCNIEAIDLITQFVNHFFKCYDSDDRYKISPMYSDRAIFSICVQYQPKNNLLERRIIPYMLHNRNILSRDKKYKSSFVTYRRTNICDLFKTLPKTEHDMQSFNTNIPVYNKNMVVIVISGIFKDLSNEALEPDVTLGFSRTFILVPVESHSKKVKHGVGVEYQITNDNLTLVNATSTQCAKGFKYEKDKKSTNFNAKSNIERKLYVNIFQNLTKLNTIWSSRCLNEGNWDMSKAIQYFLTEFQKNSIPKKAFLKTK